MTLGQGDEIKLRQATATRFADDGGVAQFTEGQRERFAG